MWEVDPQRWITLDYVTEVISEHSCPQGRLQGPYLCTLHQTTHVHGSSHGSFYYWLDFYPKGFLKFRNMKAADLNFWPIV